MCPLQVELHHVSSQLRIRTQDWRRARSGHPATWVHLQCGRVHICQDSELDHVRCLLPGQRCWIYAPSARVRASLVSGSRTVGPSDSRSCEPSRHLSQRRKTSISRSCDGSTRFRFLPETSRWLSIRPRASPSWRSNSRTSKATWSRLCERLDDSVCFVAAAGVSGGVVSGSQFSFLEAEFESEFESASRAEGYSLSDPGAPRLSTRGSASNQPSIGCTNTTDRCLIHTKTRSTRC